MSSFFYWSLARFIKNHPISLFWSLFFFGSLSVLQHSARVLALNWDNLAACALIPWVNHPPFLMRTAESDTWLTRGDNGAGGALRLCWRLHDKCLCTLWVSWVTFDLAAQMHAYLSVTGRPVTGDPLWYLCSRKQTRWFRIGNVKLVHYIFFLAQMGILDYIEQDIQIKISHPWSFIHSFHSFYLIVAL